MNPFNAAAPLLPGILAHGKEQEFLSASWTLYRYGFFYDIKKAVVSIPTKTLDDQKAVKDALDTFWDVFTTLGSDKEYSSKVTTLLSELLT